VSPVCLLNSSKPMLFSQAKAPQLAPGCVLLQTGGDSFSRHVRDRFRVAAVCGSFFSAQETHVCFCASQSNVFSLRSNCGWHILPDAKERKKFALLKPSCTRSRPSDCRRAQPGPCRPVSSGPRRNVKTLIGMGFGETSPLSSVVYGLVGLAGLYQALTRKSIERRCHTSNVAVRA
jgi:hypothetical protein